LSSPSSRLLSARAKEAALTRYRPADDPELIAAVVARRKLSVEAYIEKLLAETPPLTAEEKLHLTHLLSS